MKLIINTPSSEKITPNARMCPGVWTFIAEYINLDEPGYIFNFIDWVSEAVNNPTEGDMAKQAQKFLTQTGDWHQYLEGYSLDHAKHEIYMEFGS